MTRQAFAPNTRIVGTALGSGVVITKRVIGVRSLKCVQTMHLDIHRLVRTLKTVHPLAICQDAHLTDVNFRTVQVTRAPMMTIILVQTLKTRVQRLEAY